MKRPAAFLQQYLLLFNDPGEFTRQRGIKDRTFLKYLRVRSQAMKIRIRERGEIARQARAVLHQMKSRLHADTLSDVVDALSDPQGLSDAKKVKAFAQWAAAGGTRGAINRLFDDAFRDVDPDRLERYEQRTMKLLSEIAPLEKLQQVHGRLQVCRLCEQVFIRGKDHRERGHQYCPTCHRRWSKMQLWYKIALRDRERAIAEDLAFQRAMNKRWASEGSRPTPRGRRDS